MMEKWPALARKFIILGGGGEGEGWFYFLFDLDQDCYSHTLIYHSFSSEKISPGYDSFLCSWHDIEYF